MKPILIEAKIKLTEAQQKELRCYVGKEMDGKVDVASPSIVAETDGIREKILDALRWNGFDLSKRKTPYANEDIVLAGGSVFPHNDPGYGVIAVTPLVFSGGYRGGDLPRLGNHEDFALTTPHGYVIGNTGNIIIFNADIWHSWACNRCCAMYSMTVKRLRKRGVLG